MNIDDEIARLEQECGCEAAAAVLLAGLALTVWSLIAWSWVFAAVLLPVTFVATGAAKLLVIERARRKAARLIAEHG